MKQIIKSSSPRELTQWFRNQPTTDTGKLNCRYADMPSDVKAIVKKRLLEDQGYICCYTGIRISDGRSHIEHLKPQGRYFENHEDIDFNNLLAAYPSSQAPPCPYGAHHKADWYEENEMLNPRHAQCEQAFQFDLEGKIHAVSAHPAAQPTLDRLNLAHPSLTEMRQQAIDVLLFESEMSLKQAKDLLEKLYNRNSKGQFPPFCFVLKQACEEYIRRGEQRQKRKKAIRSQSKG